MGGGRTTISEFINTLRNCARGIPPLKKCKDSNLFVLQQQEAKTSKLRMVLPLLFGRSLR